MVISLSGFLGVMLIASITGLLLSEVPMNQVVYLRREGLVQPAEVSCAGGKA